jgi:hypothetical protein
MTTPNPTHTFTYESDGDVATAIDVLFMERFVSGAEPRSAQVHLEQVRPRATLLPKGTRPVRVAENAWRRSALARGPGWTLRAVRWSDGSATVTVTATHAKLARQVLAAATERARPVAVDDPRRVDVGFWHQGRHGPIRTERRVEVQPWIEIRRNYTSGAAEALDKVLALTPSTLGGRLLLLHGPPGTGKTTALRALALAWRSWCRTDVLLDPEQLFAQAGYLLQTALGNEDEEKGDRYRLLVLEDCDELIGAGAKAGTGQSLARLLNLTDGLLGQRLRLLVAITTNEPLARLHPAIVRPGRCLAQIAVGPLTPAEARQWLGRPVLLPAEGVTLAELAAMRDGGGVIEHHPAPFTDRVGQYL